MKAQRTLKKTIAVTGVGLHTGKLVKVTLCPARPGKGIVFLRKDILNAPEIPADFRNVVNTQLATVLGIGKVTVSTVEHLLAALLGMRIDNLIVEVSGSEIPILDGSSAPWVKAIQEAGIESQRVPCSILMVRQRVELKMGEKWAVIEPSARLEVHGSIEWDHPAIGYQEFHYVSGKTPFAELASARTFGFLRDVEALKRMGLARGGSLENAVVMDETKVLNPDGLRYVDEFARHKVLDALGDFKLAGIELQGFFRLHRAGHDLHAQLLGELFGNPDNYEIIDPSSERPRVAAMALGRFVASF